MICEEVDAKVIRLNELVKRQRHEINALKQGLTSHYHREIEQLKEELGGQLKIIGNLITKLDQQAEKINSLEYTVEDLQQTHRQYSDHMNQKGD